MDKNNEVSKNILEVSLSNIMPPIFLAYAMDVITDRALSDVRDGLKPVHRRILYSMRELGLLPEKGYKKCARTVGDVLGKYHPHGDTSVYEALVGLAQDFSTRYPLVDGHGNFGSVDGDGAAAMRYTEAKLTKVGAQMLEDINKNTTDMKPNFDGEEEEPTVLPTLLPILLANGTMGIAVGMASNMAPHNFHDIYNACFYIIEQTLLEKEIDEEEIFKRMKAPDFPTGGSIIGTSGVREAYKTGKGKVLLRSKYEIEDDGTIIISEIPYKVNKAILIEDIKKHSNKWKDKKGKEQEPYFPQIKEIRDESDKDGMRIVIETKKDANIQILINNLIKKSKFQNNFNINMTTLVNGEPKVVTLIDLLEQFLAHATSVIIRRSEFDLQKCQKKINLVNGILHLFETDPADEDKEILDTVLDIIRNSDNEKEEMLQLKFNSEQIEYICNMKLKQLSKVSRTEFEQEKNDLEIKIKTLSDIVNDNSCLLLTLKSEFEALDDKFRDKRRTEIIENEGTITEEDLIEDETLIITYTSDGIIKAVEESEYKSQKRGGKGVKGADIKSDELIKEMFTSSSKDDLLFFTSSGRCHTLKAYSIGKSSKTAKGKNINNYLKLDIGEKVVNLINVNLKEEKDNNLFFVTKQGFIKKLSLEQLSNRFNTTKVINFKNEKDSLVQALSVKDENVIIATKKGASIRIDTTTIKSQGRQASGVKGITLTKDDEVIGMSVINCEDLILTITEKGLAKKTKEFKWNTINRGGKGVKAHILSENSGNLIAILTTKENDDLFIASEQGLITRINVSEIRTCGRSSVGVKAINLKNNDKVASISINKNQEEEIEVEE